MAKIIGQLRILPRDQNAFGPYQSESLVVVLEAGCDATRDRALVRVNGRTVLDLAPVQTMTLDGEARRVRRVKNAYGRGLEWELVYEYETLPDGYRRLPCGSVVCVADVVSITLDDPDGPDAASACVTIQMRHGTKVLGRWKQSVVEEALWGAE